MRVPNESLGHYFHISVVSASYSMALNLISTVRNLNESTGKVTGVYHVHLSIRRNFRLGE